MPYGHAESNDLLRNRERSSELLEVNRLGARLIARILPSQEFGVRVFLISDYQFGRAAIALKNRHTPFSNSRKYPGQYYQLLDDRCQ